MRVPQDQGLFLTIFLTCWLVVMAAMWLFLPVHHVAEREEGGEQTEQFTLSPAVTPEERVLQLEKALAMASAVISKVEGTGKEKADDKAGGKAQEKRGGKVSEKSSVKAGEKGTEKGK